MRTSGGRGVLVEFGHPWTRGEGGSKKGKFLQTSFMDGPLRNHLGLGEVGDFLIYILEALVFMYDYMKRKMMLKIA